MNNKPLPSPDQGPKVIVLGAGISGLNVARLLAEKYGPKLILLEKEKFVGGLAATFREKGFSLDFGAHRFHAGMAPEMKGLLRTLCGQELLPVKRRGALILKHRRLRYPFNPMSALAGLSPEVSLRLLSGLIKARVLSREDEASDYESFLRASVGDALYRTLYRPYAYKLWNMNPRHLDPNRILDAIKEYRLSTVLARFFSGQYLKPEYFYYPRWGIGSLAEQMKSRVLKWGSALMTGAVVVKMMVENQRIQRVWVQDENGQIHEWLVDILVSTLPLPELFTPLDHDCRDLLPDLKWRSLRTLTLKCENRVSTKYDTYYFPELSYIISRVSELSKFSSVLNPDPNSCILTVEIICDYGDTLWQADDEAILRKVRLDLRSARIVSPEDNKMSVISSKKNRYVYPVYQLGWRDSWDTAMHRLDAINNLYLVGRGALFLHCNIDHCFSMSAALSEHLMHQEYPRVKWIQMQRAFHNYRARF